ncbi:Glycosyltransferase involved in cell wall bisynthesis [Cognatiyoonia sediminum]|uniref:Glycosyltransferase involved in cell wall bisynthesis n=1 Tax=Cognatiyoonia sediminum TaxID=1508389 RepID=A0A1M5QW01_9RHOB|nr:glycosyltransferase family 4 protein [Cognatiyoonia sediminum]SHH18357.1 Glycosyltransferase involved in cell wall bisynthesis [Cognatiyoonia sediminum]
MADTKEPHHIAYLTGEYPAVSHTFILREVEALKRLGSRVSTCSIRQTGPEHHRGPSEKAALESTFYVLKTARRPVKLFAALLAAVLSPGRLFRAIALAWRTRPPGFKAGLYQVFYLIEAMILSKHLKEKAVDHLHNHFGNSSCSVAMLTSELSGIPFSYTMHGPAIFFEPRYWRIDEKIARAKFVACISHFCRSQGMIFADPQYWPKMHIVHCGVQPENYTPNPAGKSGRQFIFVGRLAAVKGILVLIDAFAKTRAQHPDARLTIVGDGVERAKIEDFIAQKGVSDAVHLTGYLSQDEVAEHLSNSDVFVLPSFAEGVPVVLMEAMASRLPVIATRIAGIQELVADGQTGTTIPPADVDALATAMSAMFDDPDQWSKMGDEGRKKIETDFNQDKEAAWLRTLIEAETTPPTLRP